ncbi:MAG TPA: ADOP family duplicated permease [Longimicrobiales bacterium]
MGGRGNARDGGHAAAAGGERADEHLAAPRGHRPVRDVPRLGWLSWLIPGRHREEWLGDLVENWLREMNGRRPGPAGRLRLYGRVVASAVVGRTRMIANAFEDLWRGGGMGTGLIQDVRFAVRMLRREPVASGAALLTLALGVWAFITGFTLMDRVLLRPLGYEAEERMLLVGRDEAALFGVSLPDHLELVEANDLVERAVLWQGWSVLIRSEDGPWSRASAASVGAGFFDLLGAEPALGRFFTPDDDAPGHAPTVVLSWGTWQSRFGGRADVVGAPFLAEGESYTVVGVARRDFRDPMSHLFGWSNPEVWRASPPHFHDTDLYDRGQVSFWSLAVAREEVPLEEVRGRILAGAAIAYGSPEAVDDLDAHVYRDLVGQGSRGSLLLLLGAGAVVLLVALANVTNLLQARGIGRTREMAVRGSVGGPRGRLVRQLLAEAAVLGLAGGLVGVALTAATLDRAAGLSAGLLPPGMELSLDLRILAVALGVSVAVAAGAAVIPALRATRASNLASLRAGAGTGARRTWLQSGLVVVQTALAVVLVASSGLLLRSLWALSGRDPGFDAEPVTVMGVSLLPELFGGDDEQTATLEAVAARVAALPGVSGVGGITDLPLGGAINSTQVRRPELPEGADGQSVTTLVRGVLPGWTEAMGIPAVAGRTIHASDRAGALDVAVVNRSFAARAFPEEEPLGRVVNVRGVERTIVGIVEDVHEFNLDEGGNAVLYEPYAQVRPAWMRSSVWLTVRSERALDPSALRAAGAEVDGRLPLGTPRPMTYYVGRTVAGHRFRAVLAVAFGGLALVLAAVGLAGVTAYMVGRRTREIGVRIALGASPGGVARLVIKGSGTLTALGVVLGLAGAVASGRALAGFLYGVSALDPATLATAVATLTLAALAASLGPVRRALTVDPVVSLREE